MGLRGFRRLDEPKWSPFVLHGPPPKVPHVVCVYDWTKDGYVYVAGDGDSPRRKGVIVNDMFGCRITVESNRAYLFASFSEATAFAGKVNAHVAETRVRNRPASPPAFVVGVPV